jgi:hypothetical protein
MRQTSARIQRYFFVVFWCRLSKVAWFDIFVQELVKEYCFSVPQRAKPAIRQLSARGGGVGAV